MRGKVIYVPRYIFQSSALIETGKEYCLYRHYGIDVGDDKIIYFGNIEGESALESRILLANREEFSDSAEIAKRRRRDVDTCVRLDNYFATLSAMLDFAQKNERAVSDKILHDIQEDLL